MGLHGLASALLRIQLRKGDPVRLELGDHTGWRVVNGKVAEPLELRQIDEYDGVVWLAVRHLPGQAFNLFFEVDRGDEKEEIGVVLRFEG